MLQNGDGTNINEFLDESRRRTNSEKSVILFENLRFRLHSKTPKIRVQKPILQVLSMGVLMLREKHHLQGFGTKNDEVHI
jgi:hypothetical protein